MTLKWLPFECPFLTGKLHQETPPFHPPFHLQALQGSLLRHIGLTILGFSEAGKPWSFYSLRMVKIK